MTFTELMGLTNGNYIETAGTSAKNQCVDLANAYIRYVLGLPIIEFTNAVDYPSKAGDKYDYILNTPTGVPQEGDLVIWGGNQYGHIAIFIEGDTNRFTSFDENYPIGSPCHVQEHTYLSPKVLGWLHPKSTIITQPIAQLKDQTIIPKELLGLNQDLEIQQIRGMLKDFFIAKVDLQNTRKELETQQSIYSSLLKSYNALKSGDSADDNHLPPPTQTIQLPPIISNFIRWLLKKLG